MATTYWHGGAFDGNWTNVNNWTSTVPIAGDTIYVLSNATYGITTNINTALDFVLFEVQAGFRYDIGSASTPLQLTADTVIDRGYGTLYFDSDNTAGATVTDLMTIDKRDGGMVYLTVTDDLTELRVTAGRVDIEYVGTGNVGLMYITPRPETTSSTIVTALDGSINTIPTVYMTGGSCETSIDITNLYLSGGHFLFGTDHAACSITSTIQMGGVFEFGDSPTTMTTFLGLDGYMNAQTRTRTGAARTISTFVASGTYKISDTHPGVTLPTVLGD